MTIPQLHPRSIAFIIFCTVGVLAMGLVGIYPNHRTAIELEKQLEDMKTKLANQQLISPVYRQLMEKAKPVDSKGLSVPANAAAGVAEIDRFPSLIGELADRNRMVVERVAPDSKSYEGSSNALRMNVALTGDFFDFRQMLIDLESIPYLINIEEIKIETGEHTKKFSVRLLLNQA
jgi:Tfp pilus assembly protein PilO